ncbi:MAG: 23S rRNA (pseudouridine(1915)-N(3))-methyltransferase RlmH [Streptococcaceae bacterium]|nr:23S rRNA (pseudouridine(1915)-N(3))-methyltransferase RlmH [Streptococcaceae bacterium]
MKIKLVAVGKLKEAYLRAGILEYNKRMTRPVAFVELADEKIPDVPSEKERAAIKAREGEKILSALSADDFVVALAIDGKLMPSEALAKLVKEREIYGHAGNFVFVIGGSLGLSDAVLARANVLLSFGRLTLPHQLMRLVLMEQIYRCQMINRGSTYHK